MIRRIGRAVQRLMSAALEPAEDDDQPIVLMVSGNGGGRSPDPFRDELPGILVPADMDLYIHVPPDFGRDVHHLPLTAGTRLHFHRGPVDHLYHSEHVAWVTPTDEDDS